jgi:hypothetical protein
VELGCQFQVSLTEGSLSWTRRQLADGDYDLLVTALDTTGNEAS